MLSNNSIKVVGRRGMIYLFGAIMIVSIVASLLLINIGREKSASKNDLKRVYSMNAYLDDLEKDISRATRISGFRAFIALNEYISSTGEFLTNYTPVFQEAFFNGTISGEPYEVMGNSTFNQYLEKVNYEGAKRGLLINISLINMSLFQKDPWGVFIRLNLNVSLKDRGGAASWQFNKNFDTRVSLDHVRDPLYSVKTLGRLPNVIVRSPYSQSEFVDESINDTTNLNSQLSEGYYRASPLAPSFIMRLEGNLSASPYGIESFVNLDDLDAQGFVVDTSRSVIDYLYFYNGSYSENNYCPQIRNPLPDWFKIDENHYLSAYNNYEVPHLNATIC